MAAESFKVIVVGGGPVGLTAAHALHRAGIDFLVLERRSAAVIDAGSNLVLSPLGLRVLSQLGLHEALDAVASPLGRIDRMDHQGHNIGDSQIFTQIEKSFGVAPKVISRHDLTKVMYDALPLEAQRKILCDKRLSNVTTTAEGIVATCKDGTSYTANTLVGADGAHSSVRELMRTLALGADAAEVNAETPFLTTYQCLWIRFPKLPGLTVGATCETHGRNAATQLFVGEDSGVIGLYERLEQPTKERIRRTQAEQDSCVERWGHLPVIAGTNLTLCDLYASRLEAGLVSLEEGVVEHWSFDGRIVLTGDAAHKFTPSTGAGCNNGMIDVVVLVNKLHELLRTTGMPSTAQVASAFGQYQDERHAAVTSECATSANATRTASWHTGFHKFLDRRILSLHAVQKFLITSGTRSATHTPVFEFIKGPGTGTERFSYTSPTVSATA